MYYLGVDGESSYVESTSRSHAFLDIGFSPFGRTAI
jgi:hypothetical protein